MNRYPFFPGDAHAYAFVVMLAIAFASLILFALSMGEDSLSLVGLLPFLFYTALLKGNQFLKNKKRRDIQSK